jgi:hypothetical protein
MKYGSQVTGARSLAYKEARSTRIAGGLKRTIQVDADYTLRRMWFGPKLHTVDDVSGTMLDFYHMMRQNDEQGD